MVKYPQKWVDRIMYSEDQTSSRIALTFIKKKKINKIVFLGQIDKTKCLKIHIGSLLSCLCVDNVNLSIEFDLSFLCFCP